jgi:translation initiation factor IF-2
MRTHELARELGISDKELFNFLRQQRLARNAMAPLSAIAIDAARTAFGKGDGAAVAVQTRGEKKVQLPPRLSVKDFAEKLGVSPAEVVRKLIALGTLATINQVIDFDTASIVADEFGAQAEPIEAADVVTFESEADGGGESKVTTTSREELFTSLLRDDPKKMRERPPVVTVLGHVDHGKTSILDTIRNTRVAAGEAGGITQRIGAYQIETSDGKPIVFIDTPGHEAFTAMRARGAQVTDVAVLVVAADDGVMPQTIEALQHARAAKVPIVVAINKIDKENANVDRVHQQLAENGLVVRHYGGEYECVHVSARTGAGLDDLLTTIVLVTEIEELKANPDRNAIGTVIDSHLERGRGPVATVLVQAGTLKIGDYFVCGHISGRVRALNDDRGRSVTSAGPATPVVVSGLPEVPTAGEIFQVVGSEKTARQIALQKLQEKRAHEAAAASAPRLTLEELARRAQAGETKELNLVIKADAQGSLEAVRTAIQKIEDPVVAIKIVGEGVGAVTDSDVLLASVSNAIIVCFNLKATPAADRAAEKEKVEVRYYDVIYKLTEDVERAAKGLREPTYRQVWEGRVEVVMPIKIPRLGLIAGCRVQEGKVSRGDAVRLNRGREAVYEGRISSLKHFKEDVREMVAGQECGIGLEGFESFEPGDVMECFRLEREEI